MLDRCPAGARSSIRPPDMDESFRLRMISKLLKSPDYLGRNYNNKKDSTKYLKNKKICKIIDYLRYYDGKLISNSINNPNRKTSGISDDYIYLDGKDAIILEDTSPNNLDGGNATRSNTYIVDLQDSNTSRKCDDNDDKSCEKPYKSRKCHDNDDSSCEKPYKSRKYHDNDDSSCEKPYKSRKCYDNDDKSCEDPDDYLYLDGKNAIILEDNLPANLDSGNATTCNTDIIDLQDSRKLRKCDDNHHSSCENPDSYLYLDGKNAIILEDNPPANLDGGNATTYNTDIIDLQDSYKSRKSRKCDDNHINSCENPDGYLYLDGKDAIILEDNPPGNLDGGNSTTCNTEIIDLQHSCKSLSSCENPDSYLYLDGKNATILEDKVPANLDGGNAITCNTEIIDLQDSRKSPKCNDNSCKNQNSYLYLDGKDAIILQDNPPANLDGGNATTCNTDIIDLQDSRKCDDTNVSSCENPDGFLYLDGKNATILQDNPPANLDGGNASICNTEIIDLQYSDNSNKYHENLDNECLENKIQCTANDISIINTIYNTAAKINGVPIDSPYLDGGTAINSGVLIIDLEYSEQSHLSNCNNS